MYPSLKHEPTTINMRLQYLQTQSIRPHDHFIFKSSAIQISRQCRVNTGVHARYSQYAPPSATTVTGLSISMQLPYVITHTVEAPQCFVSLTSLEPSSSIPPSTRCISIQNTQNFLHRMIWCSRICRLHYIGILATLETNLPLLPDLGSIFCWLYRKIRCTV